MVGVFIEECVAVDLAIELKGAGIVSRESLAAVVIASLGLEIGDKLVTVMTGGDASGRCSDCERYEASPEGLISCLGAGAKYWVGCLVRSFWERV